MLSLPAHSRLAEAVDLASEIGLEEAHPILVDLLESAPASRRPATIVAAARLRPWPTEHLVEFLGSADPAVRVAALGLASAAPKELLPELLEMLHDPDASVRAAALDAVPHRMPDAIRRALLEEARGSQGTPGILVLRALGKIQFRADSEDLLVGKLDSGDPAVRAAALDSLSCKGGRLRRPERVWGVVASAGSDPEERARALFCLEKTNSCPLGDLERQLQYLPHPLPRFFAARCLVSAGKPRGVEILIELLGEESQAFGEAGDARMAALHRAARKLLGEVCGTGSSAGSEVWRAWLQANPKLLRRNLEAPGLTL